MPILGKRINELQEITVDTLENNDILLILDSVAGGYVNKRISIEALCSYLNITNPDIAFLSGAIDQNSSDIVVLSGTIDQNSSDIVVLSGAIDQNSSDIATLSTNVDINTSNIIEISGNIGIADVTEISGSIYTLLTTDKGKTIDMTSLSTNMIVVPSNNFELYTEIAIAQIGSGITTISAESNVLLNGVDGGSVAIDSQYGVAAVRNLSADAWIVFGSIGTVS